MPEVAQVQGGILSTTLQMLSNLDDEQFVRVWRDLSEEDRSAIGSPGFDRYRNLTKYVELSVERAKREVEKMPKPVEDDPAAHEAVRSLLEPDHGEPPTDDAPPPESPPGGLESHQSVFMRVPAEAQTEEWPEPVDFWEHSTLPEVKPEYLPQVLADFAIDQADIVGSDPITQVGWCLGICSALIRESISLQMQANDTRWKERARLWLAIVGKPSTKKGPAWDSVKSYFIYLSDELYAQQAAEFRDFDEQDKIHLLRMDAWRRSEAKTPGAMDRPVEPVRPLIRRLWTEDATKEALSGLLGGDPGHARGKILLYRDELAGWFGGWDAYSANGSRQTDRPDYLSAYEGASRWMDRAQGRAVHINSWSVPIVGGIQPDILETVRAKLGQDGCLARMIILQAKDADAENARTPDHQAISAWQSMLRRLLDMEPGIAPVKFSPEAQEYRADCSAWLFKRVKKCLNPSLAASMGKWDGLLGRLSLLYHTVNCAAVSSRAIPDAEIPLETVVAAWSFISKIVYPHAVSFYETGHLSSGESVTRRLAGRILIHKWERFNSSKLWTGYQLWRSTKANEKKELLSQLEICGWIRRGGRLNHSTMEGTTCLVNPAVHDGRFQEQFNLYAESRDTYKGMYAKRKASREPGQE